MTWCESESDLTLRPQLCHPPQPKLLGVFWEVTLHLTQKGHRSSPATLHPGPAPDKKYEGDKGFSGPWSCPVSCTILPHHKTALGQKGPQGPAVTPHPSLPELSPLQLCSQWKHLKTLKETVKPCCSKPTKSLRRKPMLLWPTRWCMSGFRHVCAQAAPVQPLITPLFN